MSKPSAKKQAEANTSIISKCVGNASVIYSKPTTDRLTDAAGTFLVTCLAVYFTCAGYFFYRECALATVGAK